MWDELTRDCDNNPITKVDPLGLFYLNFDGTYFTIRQHGPGDIAVDVLATVIPVFSAQAAWLVRWLSGDQPGQGSMSAPKLDWAGAAKFLIEKYFAPQVCPADLARVNKIMKAIKITYTIIVGVEKGTLDRIAFGLIEGIGLSTTSKDAGRLLSIMHETYAYIESNRHYFLEPLENQFENLFYYQWGETGRRQAFPLSGENWENNWRTIYTLHAFDSGVSTNRGRTRDSFRIQINTLISGTSYRFARDYQEPGRAFDIISAESTTRYRQMTNWGFRSHMVRFLTHGA